MVLFESIGEAPQMAMQSNMGQPSLLLAMGCVRVIWGGGIAAITIM